MHRLEALVQVTVVDDARQGANDVRLEFEVHGQVRVIPVTNHPHADKIRALAIHLPRRILATLLAELGGRDLDARFTHLLLDIQFDRQTVAIPPRDIRRIKTIQGSGLDDNILENLVHRVTQMQVAIGIGRAVVQDKFGATGTCLANLFIQAHFLPFFQALGLALGQAGFHRKCRFGQIQCVFVVSHNLSHKISVPAEPVPRILYVPRNVFFQFVY